MKDEELVFECPLSAQKQAWRSKHPDWISDHFYMGEFIYSAVAVERGLENTPTPEARKAIRNLVKNLLEPLRRYAGCSEGMHINSGYRCEELNRLVSGIKNSQHLTGEAVDIYTLDNCYLFNALQRSGLNFDQVIYYRRRNFIHLSLKLKGKNRRQVIIK
ncbi:D-Ala-D-Ala carboxypeptidase family metallohydrolase [Parabacteroides timonensis]|uniref:D-Ala-D-Ala carboxypeptidase family metallohydrolase n=1 Tax=Parabacteroides timonensis TaxID=1871013 RepID=UPI0009E44559|nr:D-Ala-D-Ala carboxypeptidase family metallohydrolase [Parabacteroides timonensis]